MSNSSQDIIKPEDANMVISDVASQVIPFTSESSLTPAQQKQITLAMQVGAYDMASEYVWKKSITRLKETISVLGIDFIANLLQRTDIDG
jgi:hypothetical protein